MLNNATTVYTSRMNEVKNQFVGFLDADRILTMSDKEFALLQACLKVIDSYNEMITEQNRLLSMIEERLDDIMSELEKEP